MMVSVSLRDCIHSFIRSSRIFPSCVFYRTILTVLYVPVRAARERKILTLPWLSFIIYCVIFSCLPVLSLLLSVSLKSFIVATVSIINYL